MSTIQTFSRSDVVSLGGDNYLVKGLSVTGNPYNRSFEIGGQVLYGPDTPEAQQKAAEERAQQAPASNYQKEFATTSAIHLVMALCSGEIYRMAPNGGQDIEIDDNSIDSLLNLDTDGSINTDLFYVDGRTGLYQQSAMPFVGEYAQAPQTFRTRIPLKKGNIVSSSSTGLQDTTPQSWDKIRFNFEVGALYRQNEKTGEFSNHTIKIRIRVYNRIGTTIIVEAEKTIINQNRSPVKISHIVSIPEASRSPDGYKFIVEKVSDETDSQYIRDDIFVEGWDEIETSTFTYPGVALAGYMLLASDKYQGSVPTISTNIKGKLVRVPTNYNQPVIDRPGNTTEIDWRELETNISERRTAGIKLEDSSTVLTGDQAENPIIYKGNWNGRDLKYSWSQNPAYIIADIMTDKEYGLAIEDSMIDWFSIYSAGVYFDDCNIETGAFNASIESAGTGTYENKPRGKFSSVRETLIGTGSETRVSQRRSTLNFTINKVVSGSDLINKLCASCKSRIVYSGGKYRMKVDRPDESPELILNDTNIRENSIAISGKSENEIITGVEASYIEPSNSFKREVISVDSTERSTGTNQLNYDNKQRLELTGITRKGEATRLAQYQIASSKYIRENIDVIAGPEAVDLTVGSVIGVSTNDSGLNYGYGGKVLSTTYVDNTKSNVALSYYAYPPIDSSLFTQNTKPLSMVVTSNTGNTRAYTITSDYTLDGANNIVNIQTNENIFVRPPRNDIAFFGNWGSRISTTLTSDNDQYSSMSVSNVNDSRLNSLTGNPTLVYFIGNSTYYIVYNYMDNGNLTQVWASGVLVDSVFVRTRTNNAWSSFSTKTLDSISDLDDLDLEQLSYPKVVNTVGTTIANTPDGFTDQVNMIIHRNHTGGNVSDGMSIIFIPDPLQNTIIYYSRNFTRADFPAEGSSINDYDDWSLGETDKVYKEYRVSSIKKDSEKPEFSITAEEYVSNVYTDSEQFIDITPTSYVRRTSRLLPPPAPKISIEAKEREEDSDIFLDLVLDETTDTKFYPVEFTTDIYTVDAYQTRPMNNVVQDRSNLIIESSNNHAIANTCLITGKSGYSALAGRIPYLCTRVTVEPDQQNSLGVIKFEVDGHSFGLDRDPNTRELVGKVGETITIPIEEKVETTNFTINKKSTITELTEDINKVNGNVWVGNRSTNKGLLSSILPEAPFYLYTQQDVSNVSANNRVFVSGHRELERLEGTIPTSGDLTVDLRFAPRSKEFITLEIDGKEKLQSDFSLNSTDLVYTPEANDRGYKILIERYHRPVFEIGDSVAIDTGEDFKVSNTSYMAPTLDSGLTANSVYWVELNRTPTTSLENQYITNISKDFVGTITANTNNNLTFNYSSSAYVGNYTIPHVYKLQEVADFELLNSSDLTIRDVQEGTKIIRARNRNSTQKLSPYTTQTIDVDSLLLEEAKDVQLIEEVERGRTDAYVEYTVLITPSEDTRITHYIVDYRLTGTDSPTQRVEWVQQAVVDVNSVREDGKLAVVISNINRGTGRRDSMIFVRVTPSNKRNRGIITYKQNVIIGKTAPPLNVLNFRGGQKEETINFEWDYPTVDGKLVDQDLRRVIIRRLAGEVDINLNNYNRATNFVIAAASNDFAVSPVLSWGTFTYLVRTEDTTGNLSETVVGQTITTAIRETSQVIRTYNEDSPTSTDFNSGEGNWPSFNNSNTNGVPSLPNSTPVDNANGSSSGFSTSTEASDIIAVGNVAQYTTQIRDLGQVMTCDFNLEVIPNQSPSATFNDQYNVVETGVSDIISDPSGDPGINAATFGDWGAAQSQTAIVRDLNTITTDGVYPCASGTSNDDGYTFEGIAVVYTSGNTQYQLFASGYNLSGRRSLRSRSLSSQTWSAWTRNINSGDFYASDANIETNVPKFVIFGTTTNLPTPADNRRDVANGILVRHSNGIQRVYLGHFGNAYFERTITPDTPAPVVGSNTFSDTNIVSGKGLGTYLQEQTNLRYSNRNYTLISGEEGERVWGLRNPGQFSNDTSNAGSYALIAGVIDANTVALGDTYYANGYPSGSNTWANTSSAISYELIDFKQFYDLSPSDSYEGDPGAVVYNTLYRYAVDSPYQADGSINANVFVGHEVNEGYREWIPAYRSQRYVQFKFEIENSQPQDYNVVLDRFRYDVVKQKISRQYEIRYTGSNTIVDYSSAGFVQIPQPTITVITNTGNQIVTPTITGLSNTQLGVSFTVNGNPYNTPLDIIVGVSGV